MAETMIDETIMPSDEVLLARIVHLRQKAIELQEHSQALGVEIITAYSRAKELQRAGQEKQAGQCFKLVAERKAQRREIDKQRAQINRMLHSQRLGTSKSQRAKALKQDIRHCFIHAAHKALDAATFARIREEAEKFSSAPLTVGGPGTLLVGVNEKCEVVVNLDSDRTGHIVFSAAEARTLAFLMMEKSKEAAESKRCITVLLVSGYFEGLSVEAMDQLAVKVVMLNSDERQLAIRWADAVHAHASDNDDVIVPPMPECVKALIEACKPALVTAEAAP